MNSRPSLRSMSSSSAWVRPAVSGPESRACNAWQLAVEAAQGSWSVPSTPTAPLSRVDGGRESAGARP